MRIWAGAGSASARAASSAPARARQEGEAEIEGSIGLRPTRAGRRGYPIGYGAGQPRGSIRVRGPRAGPGLGPSVRAATTDAPSPADREPAAGDDRARLRARA